MHYRIESVKTETAFALAVCSVLKHKLQRQLTKVLEQSHHHLKNLLT